MTDSTIAYVLEQVLSLPSHQMCLRSLDKLGISTEGAFELAVSGQLPPEHQSALEGSLGWERIEAFRNRRATERLGRGITEFQSTLAQFNAIIAQEFAPVIAKLTALLEAKLESKLSPPPAVSSPKSETPPTPRKNPVLR